VRTVVIDRCSVTPLLGTPGAYDAVRRAIDAGELDILYVPVTVREAEANPNAEERKAVLDALRDLGRPVLAAGHIIGTSRFGEGRLCSEDSAAAIKAMQVESNRHNRDALVAITALYEGCAVLTEDKPLSRRARRQGIEVLNCEELLTEIGFVTHQGSASA
jgi:hypothetical protein